MLSLSFSSRPAMCERFEDQTVLLLLVVQGEIGGKDGLGVRASGTVMICLKGKRASDAQQVDNQMMMFYK